MSPVLLSPRSCATVLVVLVATPWRPTAAQPAPVRYAVSIPEPATHYLDVEATYPTDGPTLELMLPVWTPGSYLVREFARNVEEVSAASPTGAALAVAKTRKNRWTVRTDGADRVILRYRVYGHERAPRLDWVESDFALINGAPTFITIVERTRRPHEVVLTLPAGWRRVVTALPPAPGGRGDRFVAADYDELVDSPIVLGNPQVREFTVSGVTHLLANVGDTTGWDVERSTRDLARIVEQARALWGALPYPRYVFFNLLADSYDGIEHRNSTVLLAPRESMREPSQYGDWLNLAAHEFTHAWNVKRLRPVELGPFDYERENYTPSLWIAEGLTDYYSYLIPARAGVVPTGTALDWISHAMRDLQRQPGRRVQPLAQASYDAWIKQYRPDENSVNSSISYYTKGSIVGLLLDAAIRRASDGTRSLDDVMRRAYQRFAGARGYSAAEFQAVASEVAGRDLHDFFVRALETTEELDYREMLDWYGLRVDSTAAEPTRAWLGVETRTSEGRLLVGSIERGTPAYGSGLDVGDELLALDELRVRAEGLEPLLALYRPGQRVVLTVARLGETKRIEVTLGAQPAEWAELRVRPDATPEQRAHLAALLGPR